MLLELSLNLVNMEALKHNKNIKELEVLQQQANEDNRYLIENK